MKNIVIYSLSFLMITLLFSCKEDEKDTGKLSLNFKELVDGEALKIDSVTYLNEAHNFYTVSEIQYFISNIRIHYHDGSTYTVTDNDGIHYTDTDISESHLWTLADDVPVGTIDSITFTFGLDEETNKTGLFPNPPESNMFWPDELGGGYHYMKLNGKWRNIGDTLQPFNFHLGIGQTYDTTGAITGFVQNYFNVSVYQPVSSSYIMQIKPGETTYLALKMNVESWFKTPHTWDFNYWGGMIMQNEEAMKTACENGYDVFTIGPLDGV